MELPGYPNVRSDFEQLVREAHRQGRAMLTFGVSLRLTLFYDTCRGWMLMCVPMDVPAAKLYAESDPTGQIGALLAASLIERAITEGVHGGPRLGAGRFADPCVERDGKRTAFVFQWSARRQEQAS